MIETNKRFRELMDFQSDIEYIVQEPISTKSINIAKNLVEKFLDNKIILRIVITPEGDTHTVVEHPDIYALIRGGIQLEWENNNIDWYIEIPNSGDIEISALSKNIDWDAIVSSHGNEVDVVDKVFNQLITMMDSNSLH